MGSSVQNRELLRTCGYLHWRRSITVITGAQVLLSTSPDAKACVELKTRASVLSSRAQSWVRRLACWVGTRGHGWEHSELESFFLVTAVQHFVFLHGRKRHVSHRGARKGYRKHRFSSVQASCKMVANNPVCLDALKSWSDVRPHSHLWRVSECYFGGVLTRLSWNRFVK